MKRLLLVAWVAMVAISCSTQPKFTISGTMRGDHTMAYLWDRATRTYLDSVAMEEGQFRFEGVYEKPCQLTILDANDPDKAKQFITILVEPGDIQIAPDPEDEREHLVTGTPANDAYAAYYVAQGRDFAEMRAAETSEERRAELEQAMRDREWALIENNTHNLIAPLQLRTETYDLSADELMAWVERMTPEIQATPEAQELVKVAEVKRRTEVGQPYIDFEDNDAEGNAVSLKSVIENPANKYVLLDFWASWCGPCMAEMPHLKEVYAAYHKKGFEIVGVTLDHKREMWLGAIEKHQLNWIQLGSMNAWSNPVSEAYGVQGIPSNFLFDCSTGKILAVNLRGEAVMEKIAELLK
ncbi:MAG: AhpC/TSA family protein [Alistipes sp.]|nr:AhpC/TSA family protein [Alistipes sp.]